MIGGMKGSGPPSPLVVALIGVFSLLLAFVLSLGLPSLGWLMTLPKVVAAAGGVYALSLVPGAIREDGLAAGPWVALDPAGRPRSGTPGVQQLAIHLGQQLQGTAYVVLTSPDAVRVAWNTGDVRYNSILSTNRVERVYTTVLAEERPGTFLRRDVYEAYDATLGVLHASAWRAMSGGRIRRVERRVDVAVTPRGPEVAVDYWLDTRIVDRAVDAALAAVHGRARLGAIAKGAAAMAVVGVACALLGIAVAIIAAASG